MTGNYDVVVIGGGAIGLAVAWRLRQAGAAVAVLERGMLSAAADAPAPRGQATWASAGMLAPLAELPSDHPMLRLGLESLRLYPEFASELSEVSGHEVVLQSAGLLRLALNREEADRLRAAYCRQAELGLPLERLDPEALERLEPALAGSATLAVLSPQERHLPPRTLLHALTLAAERAGVRIIRQSAAEGFQRSNGRVLAVEHTGGATGCGQLLLAAGAWTGEISKMLDSPLPVTPVRGQLVALRCALLLSHTVYTSRGYLVPRADGRLVIGATEEDAGFTSAATVCGVESLLEFATSLIPTLEHAPFDSAWAGLRPGSPDHLPMLGPLPGWENVHVASGHFRNGILLTPITAKLLPDAILNGRRDPLLQRCDPGRFSRA